ncbi:transcriptional repressor [Clostridium sp. cel8]|jgi:Fur family transcriptional regulator, ferric uptake regulator|uniref:Fur family transcriptional regulator n=1 Tax=unclassified Clostridium TaxID=2614128 RepID=UPI0015F5E422|nr:transcriptional repressor [Clostridium sp. cel8]MBA5851286.1 transcriptional repressor [Clostridium sp. cel8]
MENIEQYLRRYSIKVTKSRVNILKVFFTTDSSLNAKDIFNKCRENNVIMDMSTIYRTLELFEKKKIIKKFDLGLNKATYAILKKSHKHIVQCKVCHKQVEIDCPMQEIEEIVKNETGFVLIEEKLNLKLDGICSQCRNKLINQK